MSSFCVRDPARSVGRVITRVFQVLKISRQADSRLTPIWVMASRGAQTPTIVLCKQGIRVWTPDVHSHTGAHFGQMQ